MGSVHTFESVPPVGFELVVGVDALAIRGRVLRYESGDRPPRIVAVAPRPARIFQITKMFAVRVRREPGMWSGERGG